MIQPLNSIEAPASDDGRDDGGLQICFRYPHPHIAVVGVKGEVDIANSPQLHQSLKKLVDGGDHYLVLDLANVAYLDSSGLGVIVRTLNQVRKQGGRMAIVCESSYIVRIMTITRLAQVIPIYADLKDAVSELQRTDH